MIGERLSSKVGQAVEPETPEAVEAAPPPAVVVVVKPDNEVWTDTPTVYDQATKYPGTVKTSYPHTEVYNLGNKEDLARYNARIEKSFGDAPTVRIASSQIARSATAWEALLVYQTLKYKQIVPDKNDTSTSH